MMTVVSIAISLGISIRVYESMIPIRMDITMRMGKIKHSHPRECVGEISPI